MHSFITIYLVFVFPFDSGASPLPLPRSHRRGVKAEEAEQDSDSEDFSPTPSLADVSSDDLSWLEDKESSEHKCFLGEKISTSMVV